MIFTTLYIFIRL